jgi:hypothetical protein
MNKKQARAAAKLAAAQTVTPVETPVDAPVAVEPVVAVSSVEASRRLGLALCGLPAMRRMDFQDALLESNRTMKLTDNQLSILMMVEHPWGCEIPLAYVRGIRRLYNLGKHTKGQVKPTVPSVAFDASGRELTARGKAIVPAAVEEPVVADAPETEAVNS